MLALERSGMSLLFSHVYKRLRVPSAFWDASIHPHPQFKDYFYKTLRARNVQLPFMITEICRTKDRQDQWIQTAHQMEATLSLHHSFTLYAFGCDLTNVEKPSLLSRVWIQQDYHTRRLQALLVMERIGFNNGCRREYDLYTSALSSSSWTPKRWNDLTRATSLLQIQDQHNGIVFQLQ